MDESIVLLVSLFVILVVYPVGLYFECRDIERRRIAGERALKKLLELFGRGDDAGESARIALHAWATS